MENFILFSKPNVYDYSIKELNLIFYSLKENKQRLGISTNFCTVKSVIARAPKESFDGTQLFN